MKTVLCDINIILDIFFKREPFYSAAAQLFSMVEQKKIRGYLSAISFPTLFYLLSKELKKEKTLRILEKLRIVFRVAPVDEKVIDLSLVSTFRDYEDAVQYYCALQIHADYLITRNKNDYQAAQLPVITPEEFLAIMENK